MWVCNYITIAMWFEDWSHVSTIWIARLFWIRFLNHELHTKHAHWMFLNLVWKMWLSVTTGDNIVLSLSTIGSFQFKINLATYILYFELSILVLKTPFNFAVTSHATCPFINMKSIIPRYPILHHFLKLHFWVKDPPILLSMSTRSTYPTYLSYAWKALGHVRLDKTKPRLQLFFALSVLSWTDGLPRFSCFKKTRKPFFTTNLSTLIEIK